VLCNHDREGSSPHPLGGGLARRGALKTRSPTEPGPDGLQRAKESTPIIPHYADADK